MKRFFVSGYKKSGTTFLQMLLDAHPDIKCAGEQHFLTLIKGIGETSRAYVARMERIDRNTARQGVQFDVNALNTQLLAAAFDYLFKSYHDGAALRVGLNDNSVLSLIDVTTALVPDADYVFIVRDPRDVGISLWHHRMRVNAQFAASNTPISTTVKQVGQEWNAQMRQLVTLASANPDKVVIIRYEDLISDERPKHLERVLGFLSVRHDEQMIQSLFDATDFHKLKQKQGSDNPYFRVGKKNQWKDVLDDSTQRYVAQVAEFGLAHFGYESARSSAGTVSSNAIQPENRKRVKKFVMYPTRGSLQHYYHFFYAGLVPIIDYVEQDAPGWTYAIGNDVGPMMRILDEIPIAWYRERDRPVIDQVVNLPSYDRFRDVNLATGAQGLAARTREVVRRFFDKTARPSIEETTVADILVVERGVHPFYRTNKAEAFYSGSERRSIANHRELVGRLEERYGCVMNVVLEDMSIYKQYVLFKSAKLVIGQHGAALANIFFMGDGGHLLEISPPYRRQTRVFRNMAAMFGVRYTSVLQETDFSEVDIDGLCRKLDEFYRPA